MSEELETRLRQWAADQRALARSLGFSIAEWIELLEAAAERKTGLTAAVVGASMASGLGLSVLDRLDGPALGARARDLIDPAPPQVESPVIAEAIRRADELEKASGVGASRLRKREGTPQRETGPVLPSDQTATPDAPGEDER